MHSPDNQRTELCPHKGRCMLLFCMQALKRCYHFMLTLSSLLWQNRSKQRIYSNVFFYDLSIFKYFAKPRTAAHRAKEGSKKFDDEAGDQTHGLIESCTRLKQSYWTDFVRLTTMYAKANISQLLTNINITLII